MGLRWEGMDEFQGRTRALNNIVPRALAAALEYNAPQVEAWMKTNASWTDRTANARNGLMARVVMDGNKGALVLAHSVPYGIWLEVRFAGRYGIIGPAMDEWAPRIIQNIERLMRG